ncbi:Leucine-rich repeat (LRR) protein [Dyadobacter sp. BE34]|uniref:Leucine-rich repeat (LRR) protein n=1 Tax=Dyadobacter fermentans TaxID=94254 RepID=A0ABU1QRD8_9BACT|nr:MULTISPECIES: T9SS type A sorting domain-containing protein [Dyadobacter]MDR6803582.1 Leucine-rich repeat (LRR) protein [Dyadobacter fermentans]MDR7041322.1 Leucine-rich repeat (LRR) protein [Dyadobacter sp. BE242]MDR7195726.1 Leucine-rich repeat (LRR) protein [Dyadobacter sp. BE34]MDR7213730.1 Leucine-rich repeat (LRR) protein [Dyadobacter sp. BE31]MDR7261132.1 Leucine-rich repeat (LRR) protein [Dyadobacter sp. BE32]
MRKLLLVLLFISFRSFGQTLENDRLALVALYNGFAGANYPELSNWVIPGNNGDSPCGWYGVTCEGGRVTKLVLKELLLGGELAPEVGNLTALTTLDLSKTGTWMGSLTGNIPVELANLTNLEYLYIADQTFEKTSLGVIGSLTKLKGLALTPTGEIPANFTNLVDLETLYLGSGDPMGGFSDFSFPSFLSVLPKLKELYLQGWVKGEFPTAIGSFSNLEVLELNINGFSNALPQQLGNLSKLKRLYISRYEGLGDFTFLNDLLNLEELELHDCYFAGKLPEGIGNLTKLNKIVINSASFDGVIPPGISTLSNLTVLNLKYNAFTGPIPDLSNVPVSGLIDLSNNAFTFEGMESNIAWLDQYSPQEKIVISAQPVPGGALLTVNAGGTLGNNTYKWYRNNVLFTTVVGNNSLTVTDVSTYRVEVTNSVMTGLTLVSLNYRNVQLPVALVSFNGKSENNQTKLSWKTTSETNNKGFEIERSADARSFEKIGFVDGSGDTKENQFYHFIDVNPLATGYYRLKQLDYDGKFEYSKVIVVRAGEGIVKMYPNPAQTELTVEGAGENEVVSVFTPAGRPVLTGAKLSGGKLDVKDLKEGMYTIKIGDVAKKLLIKR